MITEAQSEAATGSVFGPAHRVSDVVSLIGMSVLCLSVMLVIAGVLLRSVFGIALPWLGDAAELAGPVALATCFGTALLNRSMITIRFLGNALSALAARLIETVANVLTFALIMLVAWQLLVFGFEVWSSGRTTWSGVFSLGPAWVCLGGLMFMAAAMQGLVVFGLMRDVLPVQPGAGGAADEQETLL
jgi:TRAP-type C4-dicarboxylate transport system permease small subunit